MFVVLVNVLVPVLCTHKMRIRHKQVVVPLNGMMQVVTQSWSGKVVKDRIEKVHSIGVARMVLKSKEENQVVGQEMYCRVKSQELLAHQKDREASTKLSQQIKQVKFNRK